jgi:hypothetical protein
MNRVNGNAVLLTPSPSHHPPRTDAASATGKPRAEAPILITEQEVLFNTAAAVPLPLPKKRRWPAVTGAVLAAVQGMFQRSTADGVEPHRHYPKRYEFLERSCMGREMDRL